MDRERILNHRLSLCDSVMAIGGSHCAVCVGSNPTIFQRLEQLISSIKSNQRRSWQATPASLTHLFACAVYVRAMRHLECSKGQLAAIYRDVGLNPLEHSLAEQDHSIVTLQNGLNHLDWLGVDTVACKDGCDVAAQMLEHPDFRQEPLDGNMSASGSDIKDLLAGVSRNFDISLFLPVQQLRQTVSPLSCLLSTETTVANPRSKTKALTIGAGSHLPH